MEKVFLKISQNLQENNCARVSFLIKLQALDSGTGVFLGYLRNFLDHLCYRTLLGDCLCICKIFKMTLMVTKFFVDIITLSKIRRTIMP